MDTKRSGALFASAVLALFSTSAHAIDPTTQDKIKMPEAKKLKGVACQEKNGCSGAGSCKSEANDCKGQNGCDGHVYMAASLEKCVEAKGEPVKANTKKK